MQEKRLSKRIDINVKIKLNELKNHNTENLRRSEFEVDVVNISKDGIAFRTPEKLELNTYYDTKIILWTKETFDTVIEIVRMENMGNEVTLYGCRFIGIKSSDRLKIQIYELVNELSESDQ